MGKRSIAVTTSRSEFLPAEADHNELQYERQGGCFVTTKRALLLVFLAIACFIVLALLMYYYGPNSKRTEVVPSEKPDIENLINKSIESVKSDSLYLPSDVYPTFYKLRIQPYLLEKEPEKNFTFVGKVIIGIRCTKKTKTIVMNAGNILIGDSDVRIYTNEVLIKSLSQVNEAPISNTSSNVQQENVNVTTILPTTQKTIEKSSVTNSTTKEVTSPTTEHSPPSSSKKETTTTITTSSAPDTVSPNVTTLKPSTISSSTTEPTKPTSSSPSSPVLSKGNPVEVPIEFIDNSPVSTKLVITVGKFLEVDVNYTIEIKFSGNISDHLVGLYKAPYVDTSGKERWIINTNFKPVYARNVFPCFDEPSMKTTFEISIARKENMTALSNMPLKETESKSEDGWVWDHFARTPKMTTYSVAFSVGNLGNREVYKENPKFQFWAVDKLHESNYSADISVKALKYLEDYFGVKYPLPKLDFVVVPDLVEDAVESWGLVAFRDQALLVDPKSDNWEIKSNILQNLAEQLSHQWFGKLVTISNWSDFWLREGIGKFLAFGVVHSINSEIGFFDTYVIDNMPILYADSLKTTKSLYYDLDNIGQLKEMYSNGILNKGTALLRMLNFTLSGPVFKQGTQDFIKKWSYESTSEVEYWKALDKVASDKKILPENITVKDLMDSWTRQSGYPIVTVNSMTTSDGHISLHQQRFVEGNSGSDNVWIIPLSYITSSNSKLARVWLNAEKDKEVDVKISGSNDSWILLNADAGFYRVNYDNQNWNKLLNQINSDPSKIPSFCRAQLITDAFELAYRGIISYEIPLEFTKYLEKSERQFAPWEAAMRSFHNIEYIIRRSIYFGKLQAYISKLIRISFEEMGFDEQPNESLNTKMLRRRIIDASCFARYQPCLKWAQKRFEEWTRVSNPDQDNPIPYTFRKIIMCSAIKMGGESEWEFVWNRTLSYTTTPADLKIMYLSLGCSRDPWIIKRYLFKSINGSVALQDIQYVWKSITHPVGIDVGVQFVRENWQKIYDTFADEDYTILVNIINEFFGKLSTKSDLEDLTMLYKEHENKLGKISPVMLNVVERIKTRISWADTNLEAVVSWIDKNIR